MVREYSCPSCAGNLSIIEGKKILRCGYCGRLYSDDIKIIDIKRIEDLRKDGKNGQATLYLDEMIKAEPGNHIYLWEKLNCSLTPNMVSDHLMKTHGDVKKLMAFQKSSLYTDFVSALPKDKKQYNDCISKYISIARRFDNISKYDKAPSEGWNVGRAYSTMEREQQEREAKTYKIRAAAVVAMILAGLISRSFLIFVVCNAVAIVSLVLYERHSNKVYAEFCENIRESEIKEGLNRIQEHEDKVKELSDLKSEMRELLENIKKSEEEMLDLISQ